MVDRLRASALVAQGHRFINQKRPLPINLLPAPESFHTSELPCLVEYSCPELRIVLLLENPIRAEINRFSSTLWNLPSFLFITHAQKYLFALWSKVLGGCLWAKSSLWHTPKQRWASSNPADVELGGFAVSSLKTLSTPLSLSSSLSVYKTGAGDCVWEDSGRVALSMLLALAAVLRTCCLHALTEGCETCGRELSLWQGYGTFFFALMAIFSETVTFEVPIHSCAAKSCLTSKFFGLEDTSFILRGSYTMSELMRRHHVMTEQVQSHHSLWSLWCLWLQKRWTRKFAVLSALPLSVPKKCEGTI